MKGKTKIFVWVLCLLIVLVTVYSTVSTVNRTMSSTSDTIYTVIVNSKGNLWNTSEDVVGNTTICTNIQTAINDLTDGGTVWLPSGTFNISALNFKNNVNLIGNGQATTLRRADNTSTNMIWIGSKCNILIENIAFEGNNGTTWTYMNTSNIRIEGTPISQNVTIKNCYFNNSVGSHIMSNDGAANITVEDCYFSNRQRERYGGAIWFSGPNSIAKNNFIRDTYACGIVYEETTDDRASGVADGNTITGEIGHGIHLGGSYGFAHANISIVNNHIHHLNSTAYLDVEKHYSVGIFAGDVSIVSNNIIENVDKCGIYAFFNSTVSNNIIRNVSGHFSGGKPNVSAGIFVNDSSIVFGNYIENVNEHGIYLAGQYGLEEICLVSENKILNTGLNESTETGGIFWFRGNGTCTNNYIQNADVGIQIGYNKDTQSGKGVTVIGNTITDVLNGTIINSNNTIVSANSIKHCTYFGINNSGHNCSISDNIINLCGENGIDLNDVEHNILIGNIVHLCINGITEIGSSDWNIIGANNCLYNSGNAIDINGANTINSTNLGTIV